jgi:hypothetical protein
MLQRYIRTLAKYFYMRLEISHFWCHCHGLTILVITLRNANKHFWRRCRGLTILVMTLRNASNKVATSYELDLILSVGLST